MAWALEVSPRFEKDYRTLCEKNAGFRRAVDKKIEQILSQPTHYKPLRAPLHGVRRAHVAGAYVLLFEEHPQIEAVRFLRLAHHDEAYGF
ncbi:MAG: type II toxin-antitoxin system mRNA interferase toxin, RelE/StbE family [Candidatus Thermoplasmatota archaeon]